jgi:CheY-like chemotaxis protein
MLFHLGGDKAVCTTDTSAINLRVKNPENRPMGPDSANSIRHILLIDDNVLYRLGLADLLKDHGYTISEAGDGQEALEMILDRSKKGGIYDLIISDVDMPLMNGIELADRLVEEDIKVPVIFISGNSHAQLESILSDRKNFVFLEKPFVDMNLIQVLERYFMGQELPENQV